MTRGLLRLLKIKTKRAQYISQFDFGVSFGQEEKLTTRIRGILEDHPSEISVFNELLQNADDASATEIMFILDKRMHGIKHIFDDTMKETQGPALCVYNDSSFTHDDIVGISRLGEGSKRYDSSKTGQFGIGFNAVYNVTDVPSILTKGPKTPNGGTLIVFDPHRRYFPGSSQPGIRVPNLDIIIQKYPDVFDAHLQNDQTFKREEGTWFRFPLRDLNMAASSEIKPEKTMTTFRIEQLMSTFVGNAEKYLLFMTTLRNISVFVIKEDGSCATKLTMSASLQPDCLVRLKDFKENVKTHMSHIKSDVKSYTETEVITYDLDITENDHVQNRWRIVQNFSAYSGIPDVLIDAIQKGTIRLSPRGGVAFRLKPTESSLKQTIYKRTKENIPGEHSAFSFLPLSMESTGLPLHVNGHFVLHSSRTSIWEDEDVKRTTLQGQWNHFLLSSVIPCSYVELMKSQVKDIMDSSGETREPLNTYYSMFPEQAKCSSNTWKILVTGVYQMLIDLQILAMPILSYPSRDTTSIRWVCLYKELACPIYFDNILHEYESRDSEKINEKLNVFLPMHSSSHHDEEERRAKALDLSKVFKEIGMKLVDVPLWVMESIIESNCSVGEDIFHPECIAPISAINFLKSWSSNLNDKCALDRVDVKVNETPIKTVDRVKLMLEYCFHKGINANEMDSTPLLVNESKELKVFSTVNKLFVSRFANLLPASRHLFVHKTLVNCLNRYRKSFCLKELTLEDFTELIHLSVDEVICTKSPHILDTSHSDILNKKWISGFWSFLQSRAAEAENIDTCKQILGKWTFIPSKRAISDRTTLYSFEEGHAILDVESFRNTSDDGVGNALEQLRLPKPHSFEKDISINLMRTFIATSNKPVEVLKCLHYHRSSFDQIENVNPLKILQYFSLKMESLRRNGEVTEMLSELPLHTTINNTLTSLSSADAIIILIGIDYRMPRDGLSKLMNVTNKVFLRDNPSLHDLYYSFLGTRKCNEFQFYIEYILPNLHSFEKNDRVAQLTYVRDNLANGRYNSNERESLQRTLRSSRFILCPGNNFVQTAMHFYNPHVRLFSLLCEPNELPPAPFNGWEWEQLMILSGMIINAPYQRILEFAQHVQSHKEVNGEVEELSTLVVQHVFRRIDMSDLECLSFLDNLRSVRFLCPHRVQDNLNRIYPQHNRNALIAFRNSVLSKGQKLGWTICELLPEYADPTLNLTKSTTEIQRHLGYLKEPSTSDCLSHIHNVCHRQQQDYLVDFEKGVNRKSYSTEALMESIYKFLNSKTSSSDMDDLQRMLSETPFIFVFQHKLFLTVDQVVLKLDQKREIRPYLCCGPEHFGKYFELFRKLGCRDDVKAFHFANIVRSIYLKVNVSRTDCRLIPEELEQVRIALTEFFNVLDANDNSLEVLEELYLPSEEDTLFKSTTLIFNDRSGYKRRLQRNGPNELRYVKHLKIDDLEKKLLQIPQRLRPALLSDVISERLYRFAECDAESNLMRLQNVMQSCQFVDAILIILNKYEHRIGEEEVTRIRSRLASLRLQPVFSLTTILVHENKDILSSEEEKDLFWTKENQQIVIYIKNSTEKYRKWINRIFNRLANVLMMCTCNREIPTDMLKEILDVEDPNEIPGLMLEYTTNTTTESQMSWLPNPGSSVPLHFHDLLDNSLNGDSVRFRPGEIAVYEMYDTSIDGNDPNGDAEFIYVKIVRILENDSTDEFFQMYEIYDGHSNTSVYSFRLYKMIRHPDPSRQEMVVFTDGHESFTPSNRDGIFNEIRKTLARAWRRDRNDFKRIMKRMLLKWHPDKNLSQKEFCTEVTQFILDIARRLENGEDVFNEEENCSYNRWRESYRRRDFSNWSYGSSSGSAYAFGAGVSGSARRRRQRYSDYSDSYSHIVPPNPQPASAKRWLQQAKCDLDSANREMERERQGNQRDQDDDAQRPIFNWICYKAHQAAEKALKARVLNNDANKLSGRSFTSHDLLNLAMFGHDDLRQLAREFRDQVVPEHTAMRYPQNFTQGKIPTDVFEEKDAEKAIELAEKIIDIVDSEM